MKLICNAIGFLIFSASSTVCIAQVGEDVRSLLHIQNRTIQEQRRAISDVESSQKNLRLELQKMQTRIENVEKNVFGPLYNENAFLIERSLDSRLSLIEQHLKKR